MYMVKGRLGRKWTLAISLYSAVGLIYGFLLTNYYSVIYIQLLVCSLWYYFFQNIFYAVMFCISPETFPSQVRNTAVGVFGSGNTLASMVAPVLAGLILDFTSNNLIFTVVFSFSTLTAAICSTWVIETRGFNPQSFEI